MAQKSNSEKEQRKRSDAHLAGMLGVPAWMAGTTASDPGYQLGKTLGGKGGQSSTTEGDAAAGAGILLAIGLAIAAPVSGAIWAFNKVANITEHSTFTEPDYRTISDGVILRTAPKSNAPSVTTKALPRQICLWEEERTNEAWQKFRVKTEDGFVTGYAQVNSKQIQARHGRSCHDFAIEKNNHLPPVQQGSISKRKHHNSNSLP